MCVTFFYIDSDATATSPVPYRLILANNRDEVYSRPTGVLAWQPGGLLYGRFDVSSKYKSGSQNHFAIKTPDLVAGGTWLAIDSRGALANLLNIPEEIQLTNKRSRGNLVLEYLIDENTLLEHLNTTGGQDYNGFKLLMIDQRQGTASTYSNHEEQRMTFEKGFHGLGNNSSRTPFRKVTEGVSIFRDIVESPKFTNQTDLHENLLVMDIYPEPVLESHYAHYGSDEFTDALLSLFVKYRDHYGTRAQSVITIDYSGHVVFTQRQLVSPATDDTNFTQNQFEFDVEIS